jgi:hypothetical protein
VDVQQVAARGGARAGACGGRRRSERGHVRGEPEKKAMQLVLAGVA